MPCKGAPGARQPGVPNGCRAGRPVPSLALLQTLLPRALAASSSAPVAPGLFNLGPSTEVQVHEIATPILEAAILPFILPAANPVLSFKIVVTSSSLAP